MTLPDEVLDAIMKAAITVLEAQGYEVRMVASLEPSTKQGGGLADATPPLTDPDPEYDAKMGRDPSPPNYMALQSGDLLTALGTSGQKWADAFCQIVPDADWGLMLGWFCNAIEQGRSCGAAQAATPNWREHAERLAGALEALVYYEPWMDDHADSVQVSTFKRHTFGQLRAAAQELADYRASLPSPPAGDAT